METKEQEKFIKVSDVSKMIGISEGSVYDLVRRREIPFYKFSGSVRFLASEIKEWGKKNGQNNKTSEG